MGNFGKNKECPTSHEILAFVEGRRRRAVDAGIAFHASVCEFCMAEVELYRMYPPMEEKIAPEHIPPPLMELAEALLRKERDLTPLYRLLDTRN